jgi:hypothetical protein
VVPTGSLRVTWGDGSSLGVTGGAGSSLGVTGGGTSCLGVTRGVTSSLGVTGRGFTRGFRSAQGIRRSRASPWSVQ